MKLAVWKSSSDVSWLFNVPSITLRPAKAITSVSCSARVKSQILASEALNPPVVGEHAKRIDACLGFMSLKICMATVILGRH